MGETTPIIRDSEDKHLNLCNVPAGGAECEVGLCGRDAEGYILECPGDITCNPAGWGSGICVGDENGLGKCVCARDQFCGDCSLHLRDITHGAKCERYMTGGALCLSYAD